MRKRIGKFLVSGCLLSLLIASFIVPSCEVKADDDNYWFGFIPSVDINDGDATYVYIDVVFSSKYLCEGTFSLKYTITGQVGNWGMIDGEGVNNVTSTTSNSLRTINVEFSKTHFFVFRLKVSALDSWWSAGDLKNPAAALNVSLTMNSITYYTDLETGSTEENVSLIKTYLWRMIQQGITVDLNNIDFSNITDNQETMIDLLTEIKNSNLGNQQSSSTVSGNDQINSGLSDVASDYDEFEQDVISDFNNNLDDLSPIDLTDNLTQLSAPVNWLKNQMDLMFNSMGAFKFIPEIVLMLAIALIFIGR